MWLLLHSRNFGNQLHLFVFRSYTWLNEKDLALYFLPGCLGSSNCLLLCVCRRLSGHGMREECTLFQVLHDPCLWTTQASQTGEREALSSNTTSPVHVDTSAWLQPKENYTCSQSSWSALLLDNQLRKGNVLIVLCRLQRELEQYFTWRWQRCSNFGLLNSFSSILLYYFSL